MGKTAICGLLIWSFVGFLFAEKRTNVILITVDTLRADRLEAYGYKDGKTPATTALARESVLFENVLVQTPITLPSHTSILTGTYPFYHGVQDAVGYLRDEIPTLAEWFKKRGYQTGAILGSVVLTAQWGLNRGFDVYDDNFPFPRVSQWNSSAPPTRPVLTDQLVSLTERPAEDVVTLALAWLNAPRKRPFFLWLHFYDPHDPYEPPSSLNWDFGDQPYDGEIAYVETQLDRFFRQLKEWDLYDNSLLVYTADHGESLGEHKEEFHAYYLYDASLRVPLILRIPPALSEGRIQMGTRLADQVRSIDIAPTIIQLLGEPVPEFMQGEGLVGVMTGKRPNLELPAYAETHYPRQFGWSSLFSYSTPTHKYIEAPIPELYDLQRDPRELANVFDQQSTLANQLKTQMYTLQRKFASKNLRTEGKMVEADSDTIERLKALGYVAFSVGRDGQPPGETLPDPKLKIDSYARLNLALKLARRGDSEAAIELIQQVSQDEPEAPLVHFMLAAEYFRASFFLKAVEHFKLSIRLEPESHATLLSLARAYARAGLSSNAEQVLRELLAQDPGYYAARHLLASLFARRGDYSQAVKEEVAALETRPYYLPALNNLGSYYLEQGNLNLAIQAYKRGLEVDLWVVLLHRNLTLAYLKNGSYEEALNQAELIIRLAPEYSLGYYYAGQAYAGKGLNDEARRAFRKAKELEPALIVPSL